MNRDVQYDHTYDPPPLAWRVRSLFRSNSAGPNNLSRHMTITVIMAIALFAFEIFNFDTTRYALSSLIGDVRFLNITWASILAVAFCSIDFAGLIRLFTPESGQDEPVEVWYLMGAWLLGATMNAIMTWWAVSLTLLDHQFGNEVLSREVLLRVVPVFVALLVWLTRILFIGALTFSGEQLMAARMGEPADAVRRQPQSARPQTQRPRQQPQQPQRAQQPQRTQQPQRAPRRQYDPQPPVAAQPFQSEPIETEVAPPPPSRPVARPRQAAKIKERGASDPPSRRSPRAVARPVAPPKAKRPAQLPMSKAAPPTRKIERTERVYKDDVMDDIVLVDDDLDIDQSVQSAFEESDSQVEEIKPMPSVRAGRGPVRPKGGPTRPASRNRVRPISTRNGRMPNDKSQNGRSTGGGLSGNSRNGGLQARPRAK